MKQRNNEKQRLKMFIKLNTHTHTHRDTERERERERSPMRLKPESVRRRGHFTTEDSIKELTKMKNLLARFFNAVSNK